MVLLLLLPLEVHVKTHRQNDSGYVSSYRRNLLTRFCLFNESKLKGVTSWLRIFCRLC